MAHRNASAPAWSEDSGMAPAVARTVRMASEAKAYAVKFFGGQTGAIRFIDGRGVLARGPLRGEVVDGGPRIVPRVPGL